MWHFSLSISSYISAHALSMALSRTTELTPLTFSHYSSNSHQTTVTDLPVKKNSYGSADIFLIKLLRIEITLAHPSREIN
jgi:hypothetical protein